MNSTDSSAPYPFEIHHGTTIIEIADDWSGHVLIEQIYDGLRRARRSRDAGQVPVALPAPSSQAESLMIETAMFHGFQQVGNTATYQATASQIAALMMAVREQGRMESLQAVRPQASGGS